MTVGREEGRCTKLEWHFLISVTRECVDAMEGTSVKSARGIQQGYKRVPVDNMIKKEGKHAGGQRRSFYKSMLGNLS